MNIATLRLLSQQLQNPVFNDPKELVAWMGALQAQDYKMVRWGIGMRLKSGTPGQVDDALRKGELLRTHVLRPTWHVVASEDLRWMLKLSESRNRATFDSYVKMQCPDLSEAHYGQSRELLVKLLSGNRSLTKEELEEAYTRAGLLPAGRPVHYLLTRAEIEGVVCSGADKGNKPTYALLEERAAGAKELTKEESLARLARKYFQSHSPATMQDFIWWSGLLVGEARQAASLIESELTNESIGEQIYCIHSSCLTASETPPSIHLLPPFDEYLISYKNRTDVLALEHYPKAFTNNGIFHPVILQNGKVVGNWKRDPRNKKGCFEESFFAADGRIDSRLLAEAKKQYVSFLK